MIQFKQSRLDGAWICLDCGVAVYPTVQNINEHIRECAPNDKLFVIDKETGEERKIKKLPNNALVPELCCICGDDFDASRLYIYQLVGFEDYGGHYVCYDCSSGCSIKMEVIKND
jgi:hypothetical protein